MSRHKQVRFFSTVLAFFAFILVTGCTRVTLTVQDSQPLPITGALVLINEDIVKTDSHGRVKLLDKVWHILPPAIMSIHHDTYFTETMPYPSRSLIVTLKKYNELPSSTVDETLVALGIDRDSAAISILNGKILIELADERKICLRIRNQRVVGYFVLSEEGVFHYDGRSVELFKDTIIDGVPMRIMANGETISFSIDNSEQFLLRQRSTKPNSSSRSSGAALKFWGSIFDALFKSL